jgi:hypothetical protein
MQLVLDVVVVSAMSLQMSLLLASVFSLPAYQASHGGWW